MVARRVHNPAISWTPHVRLAWGGQLGGGSAEIWAESVKYCYADRNYPPTTNDMLAIMGIMTTHLTTWMTGGGLGNSHVGGSAHLAWVKANYVLASGLQRDADTHYQDVNPIISGNGGAVPFYQTFAVTLRTGLHRGRAHSGRVFPPCVAAATVGTDGYCSLVDANDMALAFGDLLKKLNNDISANGTQIGHVAVLSPGDSTKGTLPVVQNVTGVVVDRVADVQHRRTNRLARSEGATTVVP